MKFFPYLRKAALEKASFAVVCNSEDGAKECEKRTNMAQTVLKDTQSDLDAVVELMLNKKKCTYDGRGKPVDPLLEGSEHYDKALRIREALTGVVAAYGDVTAATLSETTDRNRQTVEKAFETYAKEIQRLYDLAPSDKLKQLAAQCAQHVHVLTDTDERRFLNKHPSLEMLLRPAT